MTSIRSDSEKARTLMLWFDTRRSKKEVHDESMPDTPYAMVRRFSL